MNKRVALLRTNVDTYTFSETVEKMIDVVENRKITQHVVLNANKINLMYKDQKLRNIVGNCGIINADGQSIVWADKLFNKSIPERVTGIDLFEKMVEVASKRSFSVYYLGSTQEVVERVVDIHSSKYPNLKIAGFKNGYFDRKNSDALVREISNAKADILFLAIPSPEKEFWLDKYKDLLNIPLLIGVGGSFDVIAGEVKRAPMVYQKMGMEWFYRFSQEPRRMFKRYFIGNIMFLGHVIVERRRLFFESN